MENFADAFGDEEPSARSHHGWTVPGPPKASN
jgi:hypothetical protein